MQNQPRIPAEVTVINLTPHDVHFHHVDGEVQTFPRTHSVARVTEEKEADTEGIGSRVPIFTAKVGNPVLVTEGGEMPFPKENAETFYIVSAMVREALPRRRDLLSPDNLVRDMQGKVVGCAAFRRNKGKGKSH